MRLGGNVANQMIVARAARCEINEKLQPNAALLATSLSKRLLGESVFRIVPDHICLGT